MKTLLIFWGFLIVALAVLAALLYPLWSLSQTDPAAFNLALLGVLVLSILGFILFMYRGRRPKT